MKPGAKLLCIQSGDYPLTKGKVYTLIKVEHEFYRVIADDGAERGYFLSRFKVLKDKGLPVWF